MNRTDRLKMQTCWSINHVGSAETRTTSTCVKSSGLVESRLDVAFPLGLDARWQYNWKSIMSTTLFGCCVSIGVRCKMSPSLEDKLWKCQFNIKAINAQLLGGNLHDSPNLAF